jgi:hypothetical protein
MKGALTPCWFCAVTVISYLPAPVTLPMIAIGLRLERALITRPFLVVPTGRSGLYPGAGTGMAAVTRTQRLFG